MTSKREFRSTLGTIGPIGAVDAYISKPVQEEEPKEEAPTAQDPAEQKSTKKSTTKEIQKIAENIPEGYRL
uniref:hypothetical protein n=1 Tax=Butyrivibrio sp. WCD2001 TaxID=1280681 RepID=UPI0005D174B6